MVDFYYRGPDRDTAIDRLMQAQLLAADTESVSLNDFSCVGIGVYISDEEGFYFPAFPEPSPYLSLITGILGDPERTKIWHNGANFDLLVLDKLYKDEGLTPPDDTDIEDTSIMAQVYGLPASLQRLGEEWLGVTGLFSIQDLFRLHGASNLLGVPEEHTAEKCLNDCNTTWKLFHYLNSRLSQEQRDCYEVDRELISILRLVEKRGLRLRPNIIEETYERLKAEATSIFLECQSEGFNPGSPSQVGFVLATRGNVLPLTKSKKALMSGEEILEELDDPLAGTILKYRHATKLLSSYIEPWRGKSRAYTHFRLNLATGRLASGRYNAWDTVNRNLQNVPPDLREIFGPDNKIWSWADHGQIELRVLAYVSQDRVMMEEYAKENPDLHSITARAVGLDRAGGKTFNFAMVFGASDRHLSRTLRVPIEQVRVFKSNWKQVYTGANTFMNRQMYNHGDYVETAFGRRCRLPEPQEDADVNPRRFESHVQKCAINYPIQGTAADIVKRGMRMLHRQGVDLRLQVHDEYLVDGPWEPGPELAHIHPELYTPFELKQGVVWS